MITWTIHFTCAAIKASHWLNCFTCLRTSLWLDENCWKIGTCEHAFIDGSTWSLDFGANVMVSILARIGFVCTSRLMLYYSVNHMLQHLISRETSCDPKKFQRYESFGHENKFSDFFASPTKMMPLEIFVTIHHRSTFSYVRLLSIAQLPISENCKLVYLATVVSSPGAKLGILWKIFGLVKKNLWTKWGRNFELV